MEMTVQDFARKKTPYVKKAEPEPGKNISEEDDDSSDSEDELSSASNPGTKPAPKKGPSNNPK